MPASRFIFGTLPWYSVLITAGILLALFFASREEKRLGLPAETVLDLALCVIPLGVIGARAYYVAFAWDTFRSNPISVLYIWQGGLAIYGGILGGICAAWFFARRRKLSFLTLVDMVVPGLALAQAVGRWGNFFNMEAYGAPVTDPVWQFFPAAVQIPAGSETVWHMATFFYESMWDLGVFAALMVLRKKARYPGSTFCWYALLYGAGRLVIEGLRMDSLMTAGGNGRVSQLLSVGMCFAVTVVFALRSLDRPTVRQTAAGVLAGLGSLLLCVLLPAPAEAFLFSRAAWTLLSVFCCASCAMRLAAKPLTGSRIALFLVPLVVFAFSLPLRALLAGRDDLGAVTIVCAMFSCLAVTSGCALFSPLPTSSAAAQQES